MVVMIKPRPFNELEINTNECHSIDTIVEINKNIVTINNFINFGGLHRAVFEWDGIEQGLVLGSIYWLSWIVQPFSCWLAHRFGAKLIYGVSNLFASFLFFIAPMALYYDMEWLLLVRVIQGLCLGIGSACSYVIMEQWWNYNERRKRSVTTSISSEILAIAIGYPIFGWIMQVARWDDVIYVCGWIGIAWTIVWYHFAFDNPTDHPRISTSERDRIEKNINGISNENIEYITPWFRLLTSYQVWLTVATEFGFSLLTGFCIIYFPLFLGLIHRTDILTTSLYVGVPFYLKFITSWLGLKLTNRLDQNYRNIVRKLATFSATVIPGLALLALGHYICDTRLVITCFTLAITFTGFASAGFKSSPEDLSPNHSLGVRGLMTTANSIALILLTVFVGIVTHNNQTVPQWREIFTLAGYVSISSGLIFTLFSSSSVLPWNNLGVRSKPKGVELLLKHLNNNNSNDLSKEETVPLKSVK